MASNSIFGRPLVRPMAGLRSVGGFGGAGFGSADGSGQPQPPPNPAMGNFRQFAPPTWNGMRPPIPSDRSKHEAATTIPRRGGNQTVTEATNAGSTITPWAPSSGAGPGSRGYQGSYDGGGYRRGGYGGASDFKTKRPSASNSSEYYALRDQVQGNPIENLKLNGPNRDAYMDKIIAEVGGPQSWGPEGPKTSSSSQVDQGYGTKIENGQQVPMTAEDMQSVKADSTGMTIPGVGRSMFSKPKAPIIQPDEVDSYLHPNPWDGGEGQGFEAVNGILPLDGEGSEFEAVVQTPSQFGKRGAVSDFEKIRDARLNRERVNRTAEVDKQMEKGRFSSGRPAMSDSTRDFIKFIRKITPFAP